MKAHQKSNGISVFFPTLNDEDSIAKLIHGALEVEPRITSDYRAIVVSDGSSDGAAAALNDLTSREPRLRVIHHPRDRGHGSGLRSGPESATKYLIFYTDSDSRLEAQEMAQLIPLMTEDEDVKTANFGREKETAYVL